jgi:hypothetical protein
VQTPQFGGVGTQKEDLIAPALLSVNATYIGDARLGTLIASLPPSLTPRRVQVRVTLRPFTSNNGAKDKGAVHRKGEDVLKLSRTRLVVDVRTSDDAASDSASNDIGGASSSSSSDSSSSLE